MKGNVALMDGSVMADCITVARVGRFPLLALLYSMLQLSQHSSIAGILKSEHGGWWDLNHHSKIKKDSELTLSFAVRVLEILITGCGVAYKDVRMQYAICLKEFFQVGIPMCILPLCSVFKDSFEDSGILCGTCS